MPKMTLREYVLKGLILLLTASTLNALRIMILDRPFFVSQFPGATGAILFAYFLISLGLLVALFGLWQYRAWSIPVLIVLTGATILLDFLAKAPPTHKIASIIAMVTLFFLAKPILHPSPPSAS